MFWCFGPLFLPQTLMIHIFKNQLTISYYKLFLQIFPCLASRWKWETRDFSVIYICLRGLLLFVEVNNKPFRFCAFVFISFEKNGDIKFLFPLFTNYTWELTNSLRTEMYVFIWLYVLWFSNKLSSNVFSWRLNNEEVSFLSNPLFSVFKCTVNRFSPSADETRDSAAC